MLYSFIEIGTSCFETLIEEANDETVGLSIEPLKFYLDRLPNKPRVQKLNIAISPTDKFEILKLHYIAEDKIQQHGLPDWLRGCNSIGNYHPKHIELGVQHLVTVETVPCLPISYVWEAYDVQCVERLKIDTEGLDAKIMLQLWKYLVRYGKRHQWPMRCEFESNSLADPVEVADVIQHYRSVGYLVERSGHDTVLVLK